MFLIKKSIEAWLRCLANHFLMLQCVEKLRIWWPAFAAKLVILTMFFKISNALQTALVLCLFMRGMCN